jgi:uncharacterized protein DUF6980
MKFAIEDCRVQIDYYPKKRMYVILRKGAPDVLAMKYCPFCRKKLPKYLGDQWYKILIKEYGYTKRQLQLDTKNVLEEFKTDEWWKKRGL